jgi:tetratricopeptide (TPR) repeat protein
MFTFASSLHHPDDPSWSQEFGYSIVARGILINAYVHIRDSKGGLSGFLRAASIVNPIVKSRMSYRQRLHAYYILTTAYAAGGWFDEALCWMDRAIMLALRLVDIKAQLELFAMRASISRALLRFEDAISDRKECLDLLDFHGDIFGMNSSLARLHTHSQIATYAYFLCQPELAKCALAQARALAACAHHGDFDLASAEWVQAHLYRTSGRPERALSHTLGFYSDYIGTASTVSRDRLEFFVAKTALEWASKLTVSSDRRAILTLALAHLNAAERLSHESLDRSGQCLANLARVHYNRLSDKPATNRIAQIESVIRIGAELGDVAVTAQAYTELADEYLWQEELESAIGCYRKTLDVLAGSQVTVLGVPARRALLRWQETRV